MKEQSFQKRRKYIFEINSYFKIIVFFQIVSIDPEVLCPPMSNGEAKELWLQILCALFAFGILVLILNLIYDCRNYNNHGQLPRIAQYSFWRCPKVFSCWHIIPCQRFNLHLSTRKCLPWRTILSTVKEFLSQEFCAVYCW